MMKRSIIRIDENLCNGCGLCVPACAEGAIQIINGKARLIADNLCDGLGACLGECPRGALIIEEREADAFDEKAVEAHLKKQSGCDCAGGHGHHHGEHPEARTQEEPLGCGCPGTYSRSLAKKEPVASFSDAGSESELSHWPVQLKLINPKATFLKNADLLVAADCVPFSYPDFHRRLLRGRVVAVGCPKLDDVMPYVEKLAEIIRHNDLRSITVAHMEVPCCTGMVRVVQEAVKRSGVTVPVESIKISLDGQIIERHKMTV